MTQWTRTRTTEVARLTTSVEEMARAYKQLSEDAQAVFASFEKAQAALALKSTELEALQGAYEKLKRTADTIRSVQVTRILCRSSLPAFLPLFFFSLFSGP